MPASKKSSKQNRRKTKSALQSKKVAPQNQTPNPETAVQPNAKTPAQPDQVKPVQRLSSDEHRDSRWYKRPAFLWSTLLGVVGIILGALVLLPRPTVEGGQTLSASDPSATTFYVVNSGLIPLEKVKAGIAICRLENVVGDCDTYKVVISSSEWQDHTLFQDEKFPVVLSDLLKTGGVVPPNADIAISVYYQPWLFPINQRRLFRFVSRVVGHEEVWTPTSIH